MKTKPTTLAAQAIAAINSHGPATGETAALLHAAAELVYSHAALAGALESVELRLTQARLASNIGRTSSVKQADFLRGQCESIAQDARDAIARAEGMA